MIEVIDFDPPYQREGGVWNTETRSRLIDSIINGLDVPKIYFERATATKLSPTGLTIKYAVIDGKQRLEAIAAFLRNELHLPADFWFFENQDVDAKKMTLSDLQKHYPAL